MKWKLIALTSIFLFIGTLYWIYSHAFLEITVTNTAGTEDISYTFYKEGDKKVMEPKRLANPSRQLLSSGRYEVLVRQGETSHYAIVDVGHFLSKTTLQPLLSPEKNRKFTGDNPSPCTQQVDEVLLSWFCGDTYSKVKLHIPATIEQATHTKKTPDSLIDNVIDIIKTDEGTILLAITPPGDGEVKNTVSGYFVNSAGGVSSRKTLADINAEGPHAVAAYKSGFLIQDEANKELYYYSSLQAAPERIPIEKPKDNQLSLYSLTANEESILLTYTDNSEREDPGMFYDIPGGIIGHAREENEKHKTEVVLFTDNKSRHFDFKLEPKQIRSCGTNEICILANNLLMVFNVVGSKPKLLYKIDGVISMESSAKRLLVVKKEGVFTWDVNRRVGSIDYSFGTYQFCGLRNSLGNYILCVSNDEGKRFALNIDKSQPNKDSIDKKVAELSTLPEVKHVSAYGTFIHVSPELGGLVYDPQINSFDYSNVAKRNTSEKIRQFTELTGITQSGYTVINPFE